MTLRTGPSQEMARSGSSRYRRVARAYSTAETTLTSSAPARHRAIERRRDAAHQFGVERHDAAVDRPVDRVAVDVRDAPDAQHHSSRRRRRFRCPRAPARPARRTSRSTLIERVALGRHLAGAADEGEQSVERHRLRRVRAGRVVDLLADHRALHVVHAEVQRRLREERRDHDPVRLDVVEVVEEEAADGEIAQVVEPRARRPARWSVSPSSLSSGW